MSKQKKNELPEFKGPFKMLIPEYIRYKRSQGYHIQNPFIYKLREMDIWCTETTVLYFSRYDNDTFRIVMLLYHCCGFRKAEVLNLLIKDVDLQIGTDFA